MLEKWSMISLISFTYLSSGNSIFDISLLPCSKQTPLPPRLLLRLQFYLPVCPALSALGGWLNTTPLQNAPLIQVSDYYRGCTYASLAVEPVREVSAWPDLYVWELVCNFAWRQMIAGHFQLWLPVIAARGCLLLPKRKYKVLMNLWTSTLLLYNQENAHTYTHTTTLTWAWPDTIRIAPMNAHFKSKKGQKTNVHHLKNASLYINCIIDWL